MTQSPDETESESLHADVVVVGAGPAGLCCAIRLAQLYHQHTPTNGATDFSADNIIVIDKAAEIGLHNLSGAILDPRALKELLPDAEYKSAPFDCYVEHEELFWFTKNKHYSWPIIPNVMRNKNYPIVSLSSLVKYLGEYADKLGVSVISATSATKILYQNDAAIGVQTDDKGCDRHGQKKTNFEAGMKLNAKITVLAEGTRGSLAKQHIKKYHLNKDCNPPAYALGVKEIWEIPSNRINKGTIWHCAGYPMTSHCRGGAWLYALSDNRISVGLMTDLNYSDPALSPHELMQQFKQHPKIRPLLDGGKFLHYGAKTLSKGGYWSLPEPISPGCLIIGDNAGLVDSLRLKGIHLAMKSGMLAAEAIFSALLAQDYSRQQLMTYPHALRKSWLYQDMWIARNHQQALQYKPLKRALHLIAQHMTGGRGLFSRYKNGPAHGYLQKYTAAAKPVTQPLPNIDNSISFELSKRLYHSATAHEPDQPVHLHRSDTSICHPRCTEEYNNPCQYFCPASVYVINNDAPDDSRLQINAANCLHCKTCDIMDPYQIIDWQPPEGGGGPHYESM